MKKSKKNWGEKVYIEWIDAIEKPGWKSTRKATEFDDETLCFTNAFYIGEDKIFIKTAHTIGKSDKNDVTGVMWIPKKTITKIK